MSTISVTKAMKLDGRRSFILPTGVLGPIVGASVNVAILRHTVNHFLTTGSSSHSGNRLLLAAIIAYCEENAISYEIRATFSKEGERAGYHVQRVENI